MNFSTHHISGARDGLIPPPRKRGVRGERSSLSRSARSAGVGVMSLAFLAMTHLHIPAARMASGSSRQCPSQTEGAGNAGRVTHPQPRVRNKKAHEIVTTGPPQRAGIPCANGFNGLLRALPGESGFLATIAGAMRNITRQLDASVEASGPHDFAVRNAAPFVSRHGSRPPHPAPNVRDDRDTPLFAGAGWFWICRCFG